MAKFKVGDRIRSLEDDVRILVGDIFTVTDCEEGMVEFKDRCGVERARSVSSYELVSGAAESEPATETPAPDVPTNTIPMMTEKVARLMAEAYAHRCHEGEFITTRDAVFAILEDLGLIIPTPKPETPLEQFARETGVTVTDENRAAIEAALAWGR